MFIKWRTGNTNQWLDSSAGIKYQQRCRARWLQSIRSPKCPTPYYVIDIIYSIRCNLLRIIYFIIMYIFQGHGNIYSFVEGKSGLRNIGYAYGFYERWNSVWTNSNCYNWIRLYILCPYIGKFTIFN